MTLQEAKDALAALEQAMTSGVLTSERAGRRITYYSLEQQQIVADRLRRDIQKREGRPSVREAAWVGTK